MSADRDKFLTEAMGGCDHEWRKPESYLSGHYCSKCHKYWPVKPEYPLDVVDFSTWQGFGKLWEWAVDQEWFDKFTQWNLERYYRSHSHEMLFHMFNINPDRFATAVYEYLKQ